jgi:ATP-dependent Clp protease adaptor protein ClpS
MAGIKHQELTVETTKTAKPKPPSMYSVILFNDDFTPMEFVVEVLQRFFSKNLEQATQIMLQVHTKGSGICGIYPMDIAETKVSQVIALAQEQGHPLQCVMQEV